MSLYVEDDGEPISTWTIDELSQSPQKRVITLFEVDGVVVGYSIII